MDAATPRLAPAFPRQQQRIEKPEPPWNPLRVKQEAFLRPQECVGVQAAVTRCCTPGGSETQGLRSDGGGLRSRRGKSCPLDLSWPLPAPTAVPGVPTLPLSSHERPLALFSHGRLLRRAPEPTPLRTRIPPASAHFQGRSRSELRGIRTSTFYFCREERNLTHNEITLYNLIFIFNLYTYNFFFSCLDFLIKIFRNRV